MLLNKYVISYTECTSVFALNERQAMRQYQEGKYADVWQTDVFCAEVGREYIDDDHELAIEIKEGENAV